MLSLTNMLATEGINFEQKDQWVRCLAHVMNLAIQSALASLKAVAADSEDEILGHNDEAGNVISKVRRSWLDTLGWPILTSFFQLRKLVVNIRASPQRREKFARQCTVFDKKNLELIADVKTRWNSTRDMIERALLLREVRNVLTLLGKNFQLLIQNCS